MTAMHLAVLTTFAASRKQPLAEVLEPIHAAMLANGFGEPAVTVTLSDSPIGGGVSSVDRVLKAFPELAPLLHTVAAAPGVPERRVISNRTAAGGVAIAFDTVLEIARGVPRRFPFHVMTVQIPIPAFSFSAEVQAVATGPGHRVGRAPGIEVRDAWWVNGRQRSVTALRIVEAAPAAKALAPPEPAVAAVLAACGKVKTTVQTPLVAGPAPAQTLDAVAPEIAQAIRAVVHDHRTGMAAVIERAGLPHDLPANPDAAAVTPPGVTPGPKKPDLVRAFTPLGYDCRGGSGSFTLSRRTAGHLTVELYLDVGTWSHRVLASFRVHGLVNGIGFKAMLNLPVARQALAGCQYPIGGPERWPQIVDNLAALTAELDRSLVPAIEAIAGPAPDWYRPESPPGA
jgi:hypothetical protein